MVIRAVRSTYNCTSRLVWSLKNVAKNTLPRKTSHFCGPIVKYLVFYDQRCGQVAGCRFLCATSTLSPIKKKSHPVSVLARFPRNGPQFVCFAFSPLFLFPPNVGVIVFFMTPRLFLFYGVLCPLSLVARPNPYFLNPLADEKVARRRTG